MCALCAKPEMSSFSFKAVEPSDAMIRALEARVGPKASAAMDAQTEAGPPPSIHMASPTSIAYSAGAGQDAPSFKATAAPPRIAPPATPSASSAAPVRGDLERAFGPGGDSPTRSPPAPSERRRPRASTGAAASVALGPKARRSAARKSRQPSAGAAGIGDPAHAMPQRATDWDACADGSPIFSAAASSYRLPQSSATERQPFSADCSEVAERVSEKLASGEVCSPSMPSQGATSDSPVEPTPALHETASVAGSSARGVSPDSRSRGVSSTGEAFSARELSDERWQQLEAEAMKIPSVVTCGGVPVAQDGDLVYLGAGLYAAAEPIPERQPRKVPVRRRPLPGRVRPPPPLMPRAGAAYRSLSHGPRNGSRSGSRGASEVSSPVRAWSEGQLDAEFNDEAATPSAGAAAPRAWRPAGASKLPPPPPVEPRCFRQPAVASSDLGTAAVHSEARARDREALRREATM